MRNQTLYPPVEEALFLRATLIKEFGGGAGMLDRGLLESEISRPRSGYYTSLSEPAAALLQSLAMNHSFADGNKPMAFALTAIFLRMNVFRPRVETGEGRLFIEKQLIVERANLHEITKWLEEHLLRTE